MNQCARLKLSEREVNEVDLALIPRSHTGRKVLHEETGEPGISGESVKDGLEN